jgi:hypothetical protein
MATKKKIEIARGKAKVTKSSLENTGEGTLRKFGGVRIDLPAGKKIKLKDAPSAIQKAAGYTPTAPKETTDGKAD